MVDLRLLIYSVLNLGFGGGFERWVSEVTPRLLVRGHKISVVTTRAGGVYDLSIESDLRRKGVELVELDNYDRILTIPKIRHFKTLLTIARDHDVLYFNNAFAGNELIVGSIKKLAHVKVIAGYHGIHPHVGNFPRRLYHQTFNKELSRLFDASHVVNKERERLLRAYGYKNVFYIPNGVDITKFKPKPKEERFTVLFVGRLTHEKGFDIFAWLVAHLNMRYNDMDYLVVGDGPLSHIAKRLQLRYNNVRWLGRLTEEKLIESYQKAHVLVAPSRFEEFLLTSIEAQACGTPVIASDIPGPRENVIHGSTGLLVKPRLEEFMSALIYYKNLWYRNREEYNKICQNARTNANNYNWNIIVDRLEEMLIRVMNVTC